MQILCAIATLAGHRSTGSLPAGINALSGRSTPILACAFGEWSLKLTWMPGETGRDQEAILNNTELVYILGFVTSFSWEDKLSADVLEIGSWTAPASPLAATAALHGEAWALGCTKTVRFQAGGSVLPCFWPQRARNAVVSLTRGWQNLQWGTDLCARQNRFCSSLIFVGDVKGKGKGRS